MSKRFQLVFAAALVLSTVAAGCGEAPESIAAAESAAARPLTKQEFVHRADAICVRMVKAGTADNATLGRLVELQGRMIRELRGLTPPPGDEAKVARVLLHLDRLQAAIRALETTEDEDGLAAVAAIGVEMDAVARAANRYGLFRRCGAYRTSPGIGQILRGPERLPDAPQPLTPRTAPPSPGLEIHRLASTLVPRGRSVSRRQDCAGGDPAAPSCVTIELAPIDRPIAARRAEIAGLAARHGWMQPRPTDGKWPVGLLVLRRQDFDATVWLAAPDCTPRVNAGDGPSAQATPTPCVDRIMVTAFR